MRNVMKGLALSAAAIAVIGGTISASAVPPTKDVHVDEGWFTLVFTDENDVTVPGCEASRRRWFPSAPRSSATPTMQARP